MVVKGGRVRNLCNVHQLRHACVERPACSLVCA